MGVVNDLGLIEELVKTAGAIGANRTKQGLIDMREKTPVENKIICDRIIEIVCTHFQITVDYLKTGTKKDDARINALWFCTGLIKYHVKLYLREIADILNKNMTVVSRYDKNLKELKPHRPAEKKLLDEYRQLDDMVFEFIKAYKNV